MSTLSCPHCGQLVEEHPSLAGLTVQCPRCTQQFQMPSGPVVPLAKIVTPVVSVSRPATQTRRMGITYKLFGGCGLAVFFLLVAIIFLFLFPPLSIVFVFFALVVPFMTPFMYRRHGNCPHCASYVEVAKRSGGMTCPACKKRILIKNKQLSCVD